MKHFIIFLSCFVFITLVLILSSCKKSDPAPVDVAAMLQGKTWKLSAVAINPADNGVTDLYSTIEPCNRDNTFKFNAGNVFLIDEDATKCDPSYPQTVTGTWNYDSSTKILSTSTVYMGSTSNMGYVVTNINETSFSCFLTYDVGTVTHTVTYTYSRQ
ncbi:MAG: DUF5004 domain-containing protein [Ferruginibacter sp.]